MRVEAVNEDRDLAIAALIELISDFVNPGMLIVFYAFASDRPGIEI